MEESYIDEEYIPCPVCKGQGVIADGDTLLNRICPVCSGHGDLDPYDDPHNYDDEDEDDDWDDLDEYE